MTKPSENPGGEAEDSRHLQRNLRNRHIQLIAIGGAIGTGLFMGSGKTIHVAGPSVVFVYMIIGAALFFIMRAMGELLLSDLNYATFSDFAEDLLGPWAGFFTGWTYWFCWIVTGVADIVAITSYAQWFWPDLPYWVPAVVTIALLFALNALTVKAFGETEFWFALIKVIAIVVLIFAGVALILVGFQGASLSNLWSHGGLFPRGLDGFMAGFQIAVFAFLGIELVGTTAAETANPEHALPRAVNSIPVRVLLFYVLALGVIMSVTPWDEVDPNVSPFVTMFSLIGLVGAAIVVNIVVLTSAASSANSGIYSTSRMLYGLARRHQAPEIVGRLSRRNVPLNALVVSIILLCSSLLVLSAGQSVSVAFTMVTTVSSLLFMSVWAIILASYLAYRRRRPHLHEASAFKMPGGVPMIFVLFGFIAFVLFALGLEADTRVGMVFALGWFVFMGLAFWLSTLGSATLRHKVAAWRQQAADERKAAVEWRAKRG